MLKKCTLQVQSHWFKLFLQYSLRKQIYNFGSKINIISVHSDKNMFWPSFICTHFLGIIFVLNAFQTSKCFPMDCIKFDDALYLNNVIFLFFQAIGIADIFNIWIIYFCNILRSAHYSGLRFPKLYLHNFLPNIVIPQAFAN